MLPKQTSTPASTPINVRSLLFSWQWQLLKWSLWLLCFCVLAWPAGTAYATTYTVTNTNDAGVGSLRQAMIDANNHEGADLIVFSLGAGVHTIQPLSALPPITSTVEINALNGQSCATWPPTPQVELDGSLAGADVDGFQIQANSSRIVGFYINRFTQDGIDIFASDVGVTCNIIGLDKTGASAGNAGHGVLIEGSNNRVGYIGPLPANVISANANGVYIWTNSSVGNVVVGNYIGTDPSGLQDRGNTLDGILVGFGATNNTVGGDGNANRNLISGNNNAGVEIYDATTTGNLVTGNLIGLTAAGDAPLPNNAAGILVWGNATANRILANRIFGNGELGIDLEADGTTSNDIGDGDNGSNNRQNYPVLTEAYAAGDNSVVVRGTLNSAANSTFRVEIFANSSCDASGFGEGQTYLGYVLAQTGPDGNAEFAYVHNQSLPDGQLATATATDNGGDAPGNTSEFSACAAIEVRPPATAALPLPRSDSATTPEETAITIDVLANDSDPNGDALTLVAVGKPNMGTTQIVSNKILYTPPADFNGNAFFFYSVTDGNPANRVQTNVNVQVTPVNDAPTDILLNPATIAENKPAGTLVGTLTAVDGDNSSFIFVLIGSGNDNAHFQILANSLYAYSVFDFESKASYTIRVRVRDSSGAAFEKDLVVAIQNVNDAPTAINLSNNRINENQAAGATVGNFTSVDSDAGNTHTYALVAGAGGDDNALFKLEGATLKTNALLDFEAKPLYSIRVRSADNGNASREQIFTIALNNLASPPDEQANSLSYCSGSAITLISANPNDAAKRVLVKIDNVVVSNKTPDSCTVNGKLSIVANGNTISNLAFSGDVNERNQFGSSTIPDFTLNVAGLPLLAKGVEVEYYLERPSLRITQAALKMPDDWGGVATPLSVPTVIDNSGVKLGTGEIKLPTIKTKSGFELELVGSLVPVSGGYQINADGSLSIPNIGKKKAPGSEGQTCAISAGVTIFASAQGQTVMVIAAGDARTEISSAPLLANPAAPSALETIALDKIRAGVSCDPGLAIGSTGLFLTGLSGEITLTPNNEAVSVEVNIQAAKSVPVLGPVVALDGTMDLTLRPQFQLDLGVALKVLSFQIANADATITKSSFSTTIIINAVILHGTASINAWSADGKFHFTGSGRMSIEVRKGSISESCTEIPDPFSCQTCWAGPFPYPCKCRNTSLCVSLPPFDTGQLASVGVDVGEFTNGRYGFKGFVGILGQTVGFYVDESGKLSFSNIEQYQLVEGPNVAATHAQWVAAHSGEMSVNEAAFAGYTFLEDEAGNSTGVIISTPLVKPTLDLVGIAQVSDVISKVNLLHHGDVAFTLKAHGPLAFTIITPDGVEVTPANHTQSGTIGYAVAYSNAVSYEAESDSADPMLPRLRFEPLALDPEVNDVDLRVDGVTVYTDILIDVPMERDPIVLAVGEHTVELVESGTNNVVLDTTLDLITDTDTTLMTIGMPISAQATNADSEFATVLDNNSAPATAGMAKIRLYNAAHDNLNFVVNGSPLFSNIGVKAASAYALVAAGTYTIEVRYNPSNSLASQPRVVELQDGGVYTFFGSDFPAGSYNIGLSMRLDAYYTLTYLTSYAVDQAQMGDEWEVKVVGDTDNIPYLISVAGPASPPVLASVTVDDSNLAAAQVSWQLTSDVQPTRIKVYINPDAITQQITVTDTNGVASTQEILIYEGFPVAEYVISDLAQLGGQLVTKEIDLTKLASDDYHLWVRAEDGVNPPVNAYASLPSLFATAAKDEYGLNSVRVAKEGYNPMSQLADIAGIVVDHSAGFPTTWTATISQTFNAATDSLYLEWLAHPHPDVDNYRVYIGTAPLQPTQVITAGGAVVEYDSNGQATGVQVGFTTLADLEPTLTYYISVEAVDSESGQRVRSQEVIFNASAGDFALTTPNKRVDLNAGNVVIVPITLNELQPLFYPNVVLSLNLDGAALGVTASFVGDVEGVTYLTPAQATANLQINVDASVPDGRYPVVITGYNNDNQKRLELEVVVGDAPFTNHIPVLKRQ